MSAHTNLLCTAIHFQEFGDGLLAVHKFSLLFEDYELREFSYINLEAVHLYSASTEECSRERMPSLVVTEFCPWFCLTKH